MKETLLKMKEEALAALAAPDADLEALRIRYLGKKGELTAVLRGMGALSAEERPVIGQLANEVRADIEAAITAQAEKNAAAALEKKLIDERIDVTMPGKAAPQGGLHPLNTVMNDLIDVFQSMGFDVVDGPEVETEWFDFDALNFGPDHPARQMQDTFYVKGNQAKDAAGFVGSNMVLRTQTSSDQVRGLIAHGVPLYIACPGRVFRTDELDATHTPVFHQVEALAVDKGLTMADLKGVLDKLAVAMFGPEAKSRLRPSYFPFTEPSAELDLWFPDKKGGPGWIEWGGCGMVNPNVLRSAGIDPDVYTGFAFGVGVERTLLLRHDINDMHDLVEGDVRFSEQFVMGE